MNQIEIIEAAKQLIAIESTADHPSGLREAYGLIRDLLLSRNKSITIEEFESNGIPSLLAYRAGSRPDRFHIILNGHIDVVPGAPDQYTAKVENNALYGRGAYDMKTAAVVLADIFCEFVDRAPYALGLQLVCDEEASGINGTQYQIKQGVRSDFVICGECGRTPDVYEIANATKGVIQATLEFTGSASHGAYPWRGDNAALKAAAFANRLHEHYPTPAEETPDTTITLTSIRTVNDSHNKVPDLALAHIDTRYAADDEHCLTFENFQAHLRSIDPTISRITLHLSGKPMYTSPDNPLLLALKASAERTEGHPFSLVQRNGSNDGRYYAEVGGQACDFGIAGQNQHGNNEHVPLEAVANFHTTLYDFLTQTMHASQLAENAVAVDPSAPV
ncbi:MAG TPA: M20/M25/M40 family metallo-hydrolase [Candidatus Saccharimonadales bacterium]|nr:M20/M25/M40 family metallo-hydrolase [Candidatus Saccharimonadales bacterium]